MNTRKKLFSGIVLFIFALALLGAQGKTEGPSSSTYTAVDAHARTVSLVASPQRIVVAGRAAIMPADALFLFPDIQSFVVGLSTTNQGMGDFYNLLDSDFESTKRIAQNANAETIATLNPDLVLFKVANFDSLASSLDQLGIKNFSMSLEDAFEWEAEILELGKLLGQEARAKEVTGLYRAREDAVAKGLEGLADSDKPSILIVQASVTDGITSFKVCPDSWIQTYIAQAAGAIPVWKGAGLAQNSWSNVSFEQIAAWNPDYIYIVSYRSTGEEFLDMMYSDSRWLSLSATQNMNIKTTPADLVSYMQPDSRWILSLQWLAHDLHGDRFPDFFMPDEIRSFYQDFYGVSSSELLSTLTSAYRKSVAFN